MFPMQRVAQRAVEEVPFVQNSDLFICEMADLVSEKVLILY